MKRRTFMRAAIASLVLPIPLPLVHPFPISTRAGADHVFFDERFPQAGRLAARLWALTDPTPVQSDITDIWRQDLVWVAGTRPLTMHGVTTESFPFCLELLARDKAATDLRIQRVDRDLHAWTLQTLDHRMNGTSS